MLLLRRFCCSCVVVVFLTSLSGLSGIFHKTVTSKKLGLDKSYLANTVLPFLIPLSLEPSLNVNQVSWVEPECEELMSCAVCLVAHSQFNQFMMVVKEMLKQVESEQQQHLKQLSRMEEQTQYGSHHLLLLLSSILLLPCLRSTVQYAREVLEAKAMDDAISKIETMTGGVASQEAVLPSHGSTTRMTSAPPAAAAASVGHMTSYVYLFVIIPYYRGPETSLQDLI